MAIVIAKVHKLSICQCGFTLFNDNVKIGDEYELDNAMTHMGHVVCGGCQMEVPSKFIMTNGNGDRGWLPSEAFDI